MEGRNLETNDRGYFLTYFPKLQIITTSQKVLPYYLCSEVLPFFFISIHQAVIRFVTLHFLHGLRG